MRGRILVAITLAVWALAIIPVVWQPCDPVALVGAVWQPPGDGHLFGTDNLGRDVGCRALVGGWRICATAVLAGALATAVGAFAGMLTAWGARTGRTARWITAAASDVALVLPPLVVALVAAVALPAPLAVVVATLLTGAPLTLRVVSDITREARASGFVRVARLRGDRTAAILLQEVLPANARLVGGEFAQRTVMGLQFGVGLHVLGFGPSPPTADWGSALLENISGIGLNPWAVFVPALALGVLAAAIGLLAHHLADRAGAR